MQNWAKTWTPIIVGAGMTIVCAVMPSFFPDTSIWAMLLLLFCGISLILIGVYPLLHEFIYKCCEAKKLRLLFIITLIIGLVFGGFETWLYNKLNPESSLKELLDIKQYDGQHLNDVVIITRKHAKLNENPGGKPYIDFHLFIFNGSVFTIYFNKNIEGTASYEGTVLKDVPELKQPDSGAHFAHGEKDIHVTLRQWLPLNIKDMIKGENKQIVDFGLDDVDIFIEIVGGLDVNNSRHRLKLPMRFKLRR